MSGKRNLRRLILLFVLLCAMILLTVISVCAEAETQFGFVKTDDGWCYLDANGERVIGQCIIEDECYIFDESGNAKTGWVWAKDESYDWTYYKDGIAMWHSFGFRESGWRYADETGKIFNDLKGFTSIRIPSKIDSLSARFFKGITRDFIIYCEPGSYAEKYALSVGLPYDNGKKHVIGTSITDVNEKAQWIINNYIKSGMTDRQKALVLHNWLIYNAHYDYTYSNYYEDGILVKGSGVCNSYSLSYRLLLNKVGIENKYIIGQVYGGEGHAWNLVRIDGQWYHVDCTWDDPNDSGEASVSGGENNRFFLVGDSFIKQSRTFDDESISADNNCVGWIEMGNETYYYGSDGKRAIGLTTIDNDTYFFNNDGVMLTGLQQIAGKTYYFSDYQGTYHGTMQTGWQFFYDESGYRYFNDKGEMQIGWYTEGEKTYYLQTDGFAASGLQEVDGALYLFSLYDGMQKNSWWHQEENWYYLGSDGKAVTGFNIIDGKTFYFNEQHIQQAGWMQLNETEIGYMNLYRGLITGQDAEIDGSVYRFDENGNLIGRVVSRGYYSPEQILEVKAERDENGNLQVVTTGKICGIPLGWTGWGRYLWGTWYYGDENGNALIGLHNIDGMPYCFNEQGELSTGWTKVNDRWYYADSSGIAAHNGWQEIGNVWYYFYADGEMATGWLNDGGTYYYMKNDGSMQTGWVKDKGKWYYLNDNGTLKTGWLNDNGNWYYLRSDGQLATGWICDGGAYYYMSKSGLMLTGWIEDSGKWYYMNESGVMQTGWLKSGNNWYYLRSSGELASGWQQISGQWYYFTKSGAMASGEWIEDKEAEAKLPAGQKRELWYWFDDNGKMAVGWKEIHGQWEMFSDGGEWLYTWNGI